MDDCDIFRDQLATTYPRYGHALWNPRPTRSDRPVEVGDVGFIRWGTFLRLFNALLPADDTSHEFGLPEGYKPLVPSLPNHINRGPFSCGHYCSDEIRVEPVPGYQDGYLPSASVVLIVNILLAQMTFRSSHFCAQESKRAQYYSSQSTLDVKTLLRRVISESG